MAEDPNADLWYYIRTNNLQGISNSLAAGANPNCVDSNNITPIMLSASKNYANFDGDGTPLDIVTVLLNAGADPNLQDDYGNTALMSAVRAGNMNIMAKLINSGADEKITNKVGMTALQMCNFSDKPNICRHIILNKQKREFKQQATNTLPMLAAQYARSTPQTKEDWELILLNQKLYEACDDSLAYKYVGVLWGLAEILGVGYNDLMFDKIGLCDRLNERLKKGLYVTNDII